VTVPTRLSSALTDRYRLERELGQGGMATVYLAEDLKHARQVAIKVLRPELAAVIGAERFLSEIKTTANLQHPHILPLFDSGECDGFLFYVMPYVEGESLRNRLSREKQLAIGDAVRIAAEVADALDYAHKRGIVHRDIKPENVLLHDGRALVADFGIALAASKAGESRMTQTGMSLGTPSYMSPEQAMGEREITGRSDVYALGCMLYEMLSGDPPFTGSTAQAIVARVMTERPRGLLAQRHTIPPHVEAATFTAMEKLPADRFATAKQFAEALRDPGFATSGTQATRLLPGVGRGAVSSRRERLVLLAAGLALAAVAAAGWLRRAPAPPTSRQQVTLWHHQLGRFLAPGTERIATQAAIAPDGSSIVFVDSVGTELMLMRKRRDASRAEPIAGTEGALSPFFSPDGRWVGYLASGQLRKVPLDGGGSVTLEETRELGYVAGAWLDDGTIVFTGQHTEIRRISANGGASRRIGLPVEKVREYIAAIQPLPGSRGFLYTSCPGNCAIESAVHVFDFAADSSRLIVPGAAGAWYSANGYLLYTDRAGGLFAAAFDPVRLTITSGIVPVIENVVPASFVLSASGTALYSLASGSKETTELTWVARDGSAAPFDTSWHADFLYPSLSPDGSMLAVSVREDRTALWLRRADGTRQQLAQDAPASWRPSWTRDGLSIAFLANVRGLGDRDNFDIFHMPADGSVPPTLLVHHKFGLWEAEISHDGAWLVARADEDGGVTHVYARHLQGDTALIPVKSGEIASHLALSPDGRWLAFSAVGKGRREVFVRDFPAATSLYVVSQAGGSEPRWSHDGKELFFKGPTSMMSVAISGGPAFHAGTPRPLFELRGYRAARNRQQYDVAPDDRRFLMIRESADADRNAVMYVENWFTELESKVRSAK